MTIQRNEFGSPSMRSARPLHVTEESAALCAAAGDLVEPWVNETSERLLVDGAMTGLARGVVGEKPDGPLDIPL